MKVCISVEVCTTSFMWFIIKAISPASIRKSAVILVHSVQYYVLHLLYYVYFYRNWTQWHSTTGSVEHGHEAVGGLREAGLPPAAALLPPRHLWKPAAALLQTRGKQQYFIWRRPTTAAKTPTDLLNVRSKMLFLIFCHVSHVPAVDVHIKHKQSVW